MILMIIWVKLFVPYIHLLSPQCNLYTYIYSHLIVVTSIIITPSSLSIYWFQLPQMIDVNHCGLVLSFRTPFPGPASSTRSSFRVIISRNSSKRILRFFLRRKWCIMRSFSASVHRCITCISDSWLGERESCDVIGHVIGGKFSDLTCDWWIVLSSDM